LAGIADTAISQSALSDTSNVAVGSDQLTIQYLPQQTGGFDCEGTQITSTSVYVVQRYFVRQDTNVNTNETAATALALVCAAGRSNNMTAFNDKTGQIIMKRVDYFHILLSVQNSAGNIRDMTIAQYVASAPDARILGVKLGLLTRSNQSVGNDPNINLSKTFKVLNQSVTLNSTIQAAQIKNLRQVITQTVAVRNALGAR